MKTTNKYSPEIRERGVLMVYDHQDEYESQWAAIRSIASKLGCSVNQHRKFSTYQHPKVSSWLEEIRVFG